MRVYKDHRTARGGFYFTMELLRGATLNDWVARHGPADLTTALNYVGQIAKGLAALHSENIVHRDVKPSNVFVTDPQDSLVLLDLGIARRGPPAIASAPASIPRRAEPRICEPSLTRCHANVLIGTLAYSSARQLTDPSQVDASDDVYSLGCVFYYLLTGKHAFGEGMSNAAAAAVAHSRPERPSLPDVEQLREHPSG